ncbi:MAG: hypothetical protein FJX76_19270 [Armatimonadetes bacterium]|nr:hypothetical protein [Armatimonadota bacterium]
MRLATLLFILLLALPAHADQPDLWSNDSPYVKTLAHYYLSDPVKVITVAQSMRAPLDVHGVFYLASHSARSEMEMELWRMRLGNATYEQMLAATNVDPASLFIDVSGAALPVDLQRAYRQLDEHRKNPAYAIVLYNEEVMRLIGVKFLVSDMRMPLKQVFTLMSDGQPVETIIQAAVSANPWVATPPPATAVQVNGVAAPVAAYFFGEPHVYLTVYSPNRAGSAYPALTPGVYVMGFLRVEGSYVKGAAVPAAYAGQDIGSTPWFKNMCNLYFPACKKQGWAGNDVPAAVQQLGRRSQPAAARRL